MLQQEENDTKIYIYLQSATITKGTRSRNQKREKKSATSFCFDCNNLDWVVCHLQFFFIRIYASSHSFVYFHFSFNLLLFLLLIFSILSCERIFFWFWNDHRLILLIVLFVYLFTRVCVCVCFACFIWYAQDCFFILLLECCWCWYHIHNINYQFISIIF